ncbi:MAG: hypothetical protein SFU98_22325 [Leptospiraceae bacterium]|nr:hypothetical protein [Leptospiraceae bacterium]
MQFLIILLILYPSFLFSYNECDIFFTGKFLILGEGNSKLNGKELSRDENSNIEISLGEEKKMGKFSWTGSCEGTIENEKEKFFIKPKSSQEAELIIGELVQRGSMQKEVEPKNKKFTCSGFKSGRINFTNSKDSYFIEFHARKLIIDEVSGRSVFSRLDFDECSFSFKLQTGTSTNFPLEETYLTKIYSPTKEMAKFETFSVGVYKLKKLKKSNLTIER